MNLVPSGKTYNEENIEVWRALEDAYKAGKAKAIGLSNFQIEDVLFCQKQHIRNIWNRT